MNHKSLLVILSLIGAGIILLTTQAQGPGLSTDSIGYIATARHIAQGLGAITENGNAITAWPPLYSLYLAGISIISGVDPLYSARFANAILFGCIIYLSGLLFLRHLKVSASYALCGTAFLLISAPLFEHTLWILSESLFVVFVLLYLLLMDAYLKKADTITLVFLSLSVALACLTRYIGVIMIAAGAISILFFREDKAKNKIQHLIIFSGLAALPLCVWVLRNYAVSGTFFGHRTSTLFTLSQNLAFTAKAIQYWYFPDKIANHKPILMLIGASVTGLFAGLVIKTTRADLYQFIRESRSLLTFIIFYLVFLLATSSRIAYDSIGNRLLCPIYIPVIILSLLLLYHSHQLLISLTKKIASKKVVDAIVIAALLIWLVYPGLGAYSMIKHTMKHGEGFNNDYWRNSKVIDWLQQHETLKSECVFYSNVPEAIYIYSNLVTQRSPMRSGYNSSEVANTLDGLKGKWPAESNACLIWFSGYKANHLFALYELHSLAHLETLVRFNDGAIYRLHPPAYK